MGRTDARIERRRRKLHEPPCKPGRADFAGPRLRTDGRTSVSRLCESVSCELPVREQGRGVEGSGGAAAQAGWKVQALQVWAGRWSELR